MNEASAAIHLNPADFDEETVADALQDDITLGYKPVMPLESIWMSGRDIPQLTMRRDLEFMQMHPVVMMALDYYKAGIAGAEFWGGADHANPMNLEGKPISPDPRVSSFVLAHIERFWERGMPLLQEGGYPYGWGAGEHIYAESNGYMVWDHLKSFHPNDATILTERYKPVGIRIKNIREKQPVDLWFATRHVPAKAAWYPHRPRFNQYYGRSQLLGAWRPWRRLGWRDAVEQVIDAAVYRAGYRGPIVRHPKEDAQTAMGGIPGTRLDGRGMPRRSARDVARQLVEWAKAGAGFTLSSEQYPPTQGGGPKWDVEWPEHVMDVRPLIEAARYLEEQVMLGIGVPPELIKAGGTGSGYSGRNVPREAFLDGQQKVADAMLYHFVEQVVRPLVWWNFGDVPFQVLCKSLLGSQAQDKKGMGEAESPDSYARSQAAKDAWARRKVVSNPQGATISPSPAAGVPMAVSDKIIRIAARVMGRAA